MPGYAVLQNRSDLLNYNNNRKRRVFNGQEGRGLGLSWCVPNYDDFEALFVSAIHLDMLVFILGTTHPLCFLVLILQKRTKNCRALVF